MVENTSKRRKFFLKRNLKKVVPKFAHKWHCYFIAEKLSIENLRSSYNNLLFIINYNGLACGIKLSSVCVWFELHRTHKLRFFSIKSILKNMLLIYFFHVFLAVLKVSALYGQFLKIKFLIFLNKTFDHDE